MRVGRWVTGDAISTCVCRCSMLVFCYVDYVGACNVPFVVLLTWVEFLLLYMPLNYVLCVCTA